jgi:uncharacterized Zn-finger protein
MEIRIRLRVDRTDPEINHLTVHAVKYDDRQAQCELVKLATARHPKVYFLPVVKPELN